MKVFLVLVEGKQQKATNVTATHAEFPGPCPSCGSEALECHGTTGAQIGGHDYYESNAIARCCGKDLGKMRAYMSTIFGLEEDEAVIEKGRCRVYP